MRNFKVVTFSVLLLFVSFVSIAAQSAPVAIVPIQFRDSRPVIEVMLNGKGPFIFSIDTGGGLAADIDSSIAAQLKLEPSGKVRGGDPSGRNFREFDTVLIDSLAFGGLEFRNVTALSREQRLTPNAPRVDGILGFALFEDYLLTLDYPGKQVRLARGELPAANGANILTFESPRRIPVVDVLVGNIKMKAHLDSGNMVGRFILPTSLVDKLTLASPPVTVGRARTVNNEVEIKEAKLTDSIKLGSFEFSQPTITFPALAEVVNIGLSVLREFSLTFDQKNKRVKLERPAPAATAAASSPETNEFTGSYGERTISFNDSTLYLQRRDGPKIKLVAAGKDEFTLERVPSARIKFARDAQGKVIELQVLNQSGQWESSKKTQP
ncbi:MAG: aspartyl protease family protein [Acidobacteriota bacterium]